MNQQMEPCSEFVDNTSVPVRGLLHRPATPSGHWLVLTHGAGSNCQSPLLRALAEAFAALGINVLRVDLPFRQSRPHGPPPRGSAERDQEGLKAAIDATHREGAARVFLGGHSYGGRQASMVVASDPTLTAALLLLSYPLHPPKRPTELRTEHFPDLRTPTLFVHGTRDGFGSISEMAEARTQIHAKNELLAVQSAGHELLTARNRVELPSLIAKTFLTFVK
jgi:predicted alpha/beta-hydrolase family hydrolase